MAKGDDFGSGASGANLFLQNLQLLSKLVSLTSLNFAPSLLFNFNTGGGQDNKFAIGVFVPGPSGAVAVGLKSSPFWTGWSDGTNQAKFTATGAVQVALTTPVTPPPNTTIKNAVVYTLSPPITNSPSPVTIFSKVYTPVSSSSTLLIIAAAQISNATPGASEVDVSLNINSLFYTSGRTFQNSDVGTVSIYTYYLASGVAITITEVATLFSGSTNLNVPVASLTIIEF